MTLAWWFEPADGLLQYGDGRKPEKGITHTVCVKPVPCKAGLHASVRSIDALVYARSSVLWRVQLGGAIVHDNKKCSATERTYIQRIDIEPQLREFARWCALQVIHLWDAPDVVRQYLETGDESLRDAAQAAVWDAAEDVASEAAAARAAAWAADAAAAATATATADAAREAANAARVAAAASAVRDARDARSAAAASAVRDAESAWAAAWDAQNVELERLVLTALATKESAQ